MTMSTRDLLLLIGLIVTAYALALGAVAVIVGALCRREMRTEDPRPEIQCSRCRVYILATRIRFAASGLPHCPECLEDALWEDR